MAMWKSFCIFCNIILKKIYVILCILKILTLLSLWKDLFLLKLTMRKICLCLEEICNLSECSLFLAWQISLSFWNLLTPQVPLWQDPPGWASWTCLRSLTPWNTTYEQFKSPFFSCITFFFLYCSALVTTEGRQHQQMRENN